MRNATYSPLTEEQIKEFMPQGVDPVEPAVPVVEAPVEPVAETPVEPTEG